MKGATSTQLLRIASEAGAFVTSLDGRNLAGLDDAAIGQMMISLGRDSAGDTGFTRLTELNLTGKHYFSAVRMSFF